MVDGVHGHAGRAFYPSKVCLQPSKLQRMFILLTFVINLNVITVIYVLQLSAKCFLLITKQLGTHVQSLAI